MTGQLTNFTHYNATLRLYENFSTMNVFFFYKESLPDGVRLRVTHADGVEGDYGAAAVGAANLEGTPSDLLCAKIISTNLPQCDQLTLSAELPDGTILFTVNYAIKDVTYPSGAQSNPDKKNE